MIVYYRMCDVKSKLSKPSPIHADNLYKLHELCLTSFIKAWEDVGPKMVFIADFCGEEYQDMVSDLVPFDYEYKNTAFGINETCLLQYKMYEQTNEDAVLFQEYDYLWQPNTGIEIVQALELFDFVTPYDHPDKYELELEPRVKAVGNRYWKQTQSTTATFATTAAAFKTYKKILYRYGYIDHKRWIDIGRKGGQLWSPLPSIATHMVKDFMAPHVDWSSILKTSPPDFLP